MNLIIAIVKRLLKRKNIRHGDSDESPHETTGQQSTMSNTNTRNNVKQRIVIRRSGDRGLSRFSWLTSYHSFSFANYYDPRFLGISALRVINDDTVAAGGGFPTHPHRDMEIISYVISGRIHHKDSHGHEHVLSGGDIQVMSAGTGILHSEFNPHRTQDLRFLQIWIIPNANNVEPGYQTKSLDNDPGLSLLVSGDASDNALFIHQDAKLYRGFYATPRSETVTLNKTRTFYLHLISGELSVIDEPDEQNNATDAQHEITEIQLHPGDAVTIINSRVMNIVCHSPCEFLLFDLPTKH